MIIIYACFSGTHAAVIAAALHLGLLQADVMPGWQQLQNLPHFDAPEGRGGLRYIGCTPAGHTVFTAAVGHDGEAARRAVKSFLEAVGRRRDDVLWLDVAGQVSFLWRLGSFCRRYPILSWFGRRLLQYRLQKDYALLVKLAGDGRRAEALLPAYPQGL